MKVRPKLPEEQQKQLLQLAEVHGLYKAAQIVGINRQTYAVLAAGFPANGMTILGVKTRLAELESEESREGP
jgi:uncharacterized protein (DUF302 family)